MVKVFVNEAGRSLLLENIASADSLTSSRIAYVECRAAISRAERDSRLNSKEAAGAVENLNHRWPELQAVELDGHLTKQAGDLTRTQRLRAGDAIHLASAAVLVEKDTSEVTFACWD
ncbi:MAG: type II toxin-antitoxin system VapC family toxin, partial [Actinomycetota bacterium]